MAMASIAPGTAVRFALLALLASEPAHGYELKRRFDRSVGGVWPLNIGQVYDALRRLERDALVEELDNHDGERRPFAITETGRRVADSWLATVVGNAAPPRDELAIRVLVARETGLVSFCAYVQSQREACMEGLQRLARRKAALDPQTDAAELALADLLMLRGEADARWLDLIEARARAGGEER